MTFLFTVIINALAVWFGSQFLEGIKVTDFVRAVIAGLIVALLNAVLGTLLDWFPNPTRYISFGLFNMVLNAALLMLADYLLKGLAIKNFWWALALAAVISVANGVANWLF